MKLRKQEVKLPGTTLHLTAEESKLIAAFTAGLTPSSVKDAMLMGGRFGKNDAEKMARLTEEMFEWYRNEGYY